MNHILKSIAHTVKAREIINYFKYDVNPRKFLLKLKYKKAMTACKDIHRGKRCFIIGNGPSLTAEDLDCIADEYCFAANRIFYIFPSTKWRPTYYASQDRVVVEDCKEHYQKLSKICSNLFIADITYPCCAKEVMQCENGIFFDVLRTHSNSKRFFSEDVSKKVCAGSNIIFTCMQIAAFMGFTEIYLLGVDHNYSTPSFKDNKISAEDVKKSYFKGVPATMTMSKPNLPSVTRSFTIAKEYADTHNLKIYNATRGGKLEIFERVDFDKLVAGNVYE